MTSWMDRWPLLTIGLLGFFFKLPLLAWMWLKVSGSLCATLLCEWSSFQRL